MLYRRYIKYFNAMIFAFFMFVGFTISVYAYEVESNYGRVSIDDENYSATFNFADEEKLTYDDLFLLNSIISDNKKDSKTVYRMYINTQNLCDVIQNIYPNCTYENSKNKVRIRLHEFNESHYIEYTITFYDDNIYSQVVEKNDDSIYTIADNSRPNSSNPNENNNDQEATLLIIDNEKYVPVRLFSEVLFYDVSFNINEKSATIDTYSILNKPNVTCSMVNKTDSYYLYNNCEDGKFYVIPSNIRVYVSPSTQRDNKIISGLGYSNESEIMNKIADFLVPALESKGIVTFRNEPTMNVSQAVADSKKHDVDFHFAIHSNAGGGTGPEIWVAQNGTDEAYALAGKIYNSLLEIYPNPNGGRGIKNNQELAETNPNNVNNGVLVEVAFHDNMDDAKWIVDNFELIGNTMANAIADYYSEKK